MRAKNWMFLTAFFLLLASCNLPVAKEPAAAGSPAATSVDAMGTAVELTTVAKMTEIARSAAPTATVVDKPASVPSETPSPTLSPTPSSIVCVPMVTASTIANIRSGPGTAYDVIGSLPLGGTAKVAGRNDANTWWYIEFSGGVGGHAWVAGIVTTTSCLPSVVQVVAAPSLPTAQPQADTSAPEATADISLPPPVAGVPDLVASGMQWSSSPKKNQPISIQVRVTNSGTGAAGPFTVVWYANQDEVGCTWNSPGLAAGASKNFDCQHVYNDFPTKTSTYWVTLKVDTGNQVAESNESNNARDTPRLIVKP